MKQGRNIFVEEDGPVIHRSQDIYVHKLYFKVKCNLSISTLTVALIPA